MPSSVPQPALKESLTPDEIRRVHETIYELVVNAGDYSSFKNPDQAETLFGELFEILEAQGG